VLNKFEFISENFKNYLRILIWIYFLTFFCHFGDLFDIDLFFDQFFCLNRVQFPVNADQKIGLFFGSKRCHNFSDGPDIFVNHLHVHHLVKGRIIRRVIFDNKTRFTVQMRDCSEPFHVILKIRKYYKLEFQFQIKRSVFIISIFLKMIIFKSLNPLWFNL